MNDLIETHLREHGFYVSTTVGVSMKPMLKTRRDRVVIKPLNGERLKRLDLPLYRLPNGKYVLHRVIAVKDGYYIMRGDNTYAKEKIAEDQILGVMTEFYRKDRHVLADNRKYRAYAEVWQWIYPIRFVWHYFYLFCSRVKNKLFPKKAK